MKALKNLEEIPENFDSIEEEIEFWETHDLGDVLTDLQPVRFTLPEEEVILNILKKSMRAGRRRATSRPTARNTMYARAYARKAVRMHKRTQSHI
jgi:hypothetical protein